MSVKVNLKVVGTLQKHLLFETCICVWNGSGGTLLDVRHLSTLELPDGRAAG